MRSTTRRALLAVAGLCAAVPAAAVATGPLTGVPAQPKVTGSPVPTIVSPGFALQTVAEGAMPVENPADVVASAATGIPAPASPVSITNYGWYGDGPVLAASGPVATLSEPDKNTYLTFPRGAIAGPDAGYDYGRHFLFQGHEAGPGNAGYYTRVNLDADAAHRVTLLASRTTTGDQIPATDGSIWDPFTKTLLFSGEEGPELGGIWQAGPSSPSPVTDLSGAFGRGGFEGLSVDAAGRVWVVEDSGGASPSSASALDNARIPNSYVYRLVPKDVHDLTKGGVLQVLQVTRSDGSGPITAATCGATPTDACLEAAATSQDVKDLHTYGTRFATRWIPIHDTATDGTAAFDANALAAKLGGTPFKRPENGAFRPGGGFREFFFTETGDTNAQKAAGGAFGQWGAIFKLTQRDPTANTGTLSLAYLADEEHAGLDNVNFLNRNLLIAVEDAGDTLHDQRGTTDSGDVIDVRQAQPTPIRMIAQGRDPIATLRDADNELTGITISDGATSVAGLLGTRVPRPFAPGSPWRVFVTQQHGQNLTQEIVRASTPAD